MFHGVRKLIVIAATVNAAVAATVGGIVKDAQGGEALARVRVQLTGAGLEGVTDSAGQFRFETVGAGKYTLNVETVGYRLLKRDIEVEDADLAFELVLSPDTFRRTDSVEVRADVFEPVAANSPTEQTMLSSEVKNLGTVLLDDPVRAMHTLPGVAANDDFYAQFSVRGAPFERVGFYLDDVLLHSPFHTMQGVSDTGSVSILNTDMLESLALLPVAFPSRYGDRTGSAVEVRSRDGSRTKRNVRGSVNVASATAMTEGPIGSRGSYIASVRKSYLEHLVSSVTDDPTLAIGFLDYQTKVSYDLTQSQAVSLHLMQGATDIDRTGARATSGVNSIVGAEYRPTIARTSWRWTANERLVMNATGAWMRERFDNRNRDGLPLGSGYYGEWVANGSAAWHRTGAHTLEAGWSTRRLRDAGFLTSFFNNTSTVRLFDEYRETALRHGAFIQQTVRAGRVRLNTGVRWDRHDMASGHAGSPHASAAIRLTGSTEVHLGWGQYVQLPEVWIYTARDGGRRLAPQRSSHYIAGVEQRIGNQTRVRAEVFNRDDRDLIARPLVDPRVSPETGQIVIPRDTRLYNSVRGYSRGAQFVLQRRSANRVGGWVGYTLLFARQRDAVEGLSFPSLEDQRHLVNAYASYRFTPSLNLSATYTYGSGVPMGGFLRRDGENVYSLVAERNRATLGPYKRLDLRANKSFSYERWKFTLYGELINATNHRNVRMDSFNGIDTRTGRAFVSVIRVFPMLPSGGLMVEF